jgi:hypothetical protein
MITELPKSAQKHIKSGYTVRGHSPYRFDHIANKQADLLQERAASPHVVVTINDSFSSDKTSRHRNIYFTDNLPLAISLAASLAIESLEVAEEVVEIRAATAEEIDAFTRFINLALEVEPLVIRAQEL